MLLSTRPPLAAFALIACFSMSLARLDAEKARSASRKLPKVEIKLSGPRSVQPGESLEAQFFKATLTNRSAEPLVFFARSGYLMNARWRWTVTDAKDQPLGMAFIIRGMCGTVPYSEEGLAAARLIHDDEVTLIGPGESHEFPIPVRISDDYNFPAAGTYTLRVTLTYVVPNAAFYIDERGKRVETRPSQGFFDTGGYEQWNLSQLSADSLAMLQESQSLQATSEAWNLRMPEARMHKDSLPTLTITWPKPRR